MGRKQKPADPQAIMLRRARAEYAERLADRDPAQWGISAQILELPTAADVSSAKAHRDQVKWARRSDAFELLHAAKRWDEDGHLTAGISDAHKKAADRYVKDWMERMGVGHAYEIRDRVDEGAADEKRGRVDVMVAAGERLDDTHAKLGRTSLRVLRALAESMVAGEVRPWRAIVKAATGEADATAQAAVVRWACEELRLAHDELDGVVQPGDGSERPVPIRVWQAE